MSKTANNWRGSKSVALEQQLSRQVGGAVGVDWSFDRKRPGLMKWLTPTLQWCPSIRPYELCACDSGQVLIRNSGRHRSTSCCCATTPVVAASAIDACFNGIVVNTPEQVLMLLYLCLRYVSLLDRVTPVSPASFRSSRP